MKKSYRPTIRQIMAKYDWDPSGVVLAALLLIGEATATGLAAVSLVSDGFDWGRLAALLGAAVLVLYVPLAIWKGKMPFAITTEYEKRRRYAQETIGVKIPRSGDVTKDGQQLPPTQVNLKNDSDASIRVAVGRAYPLGDSTLRDFRNVRWRKDVNLKIIRACHQLTPITGTFSIITHSKDLKEQSPTTQHETLIAESDSSAPPDPQD